MPLVPLTREFRASSRPLLNQAVNETQAPPGKKTALKRWLEETIDSNGVQIFLSVTLFVTLFLPDIWVVSNISNDNDFILNAVRARARGARARLARRRATDGVSERERSGAQILLTSFVFFVIEMVCLCVARREYRGSFFFCMDMLGTVSILLDVTMFARMVNNWSADGVNDGSVLRAARVAKIGAKSGRLAKLVRLFRLLFSKDDNGVRRCARLANSGARPYAAWSFPPGFVCGAGEGPAAGFHGLGAAVQVARAARRSSRDDYHRRHAVAHLHTGRPLSRVIR